MPAPSLDPQVQAFYETAPEPLRAGLLDLRDTIFAVATEIEETGGVEETLKWAQPAYLPKRPRVGTTLRLGLPKTGGFGLYVHCQTSLIGDFATAFPDLQYEGNRAILFSEGAVPDERINLFVGNALTYHLKR
ncbi:DUF1801 domain-containing protein [Shimia sp. SDUM112013]|uniref:DUF1801 domain-containing protein n=1 Tax=Shimia sp. SDUM112013 TaxID=3136160 RepID=UPI0032EDAE75